MGISETKAVLIMADSDYKDLLPPSPYLIYINEQHQLQQSRQRMKRFCCLSNFFHNVSLQGLCLVHCWITAFHSDKFYISARATACHKKFSLLSICSVHMKYPCQFLFPSPYRFLPTYFIRCS